MKILQGHFQSQLAFYLCFSNFVSCKKGNHRFPHSSENRVTDGHFGKLGVAGGGGGDAGGRRWERLGIAKANSYVNDSKRAFNMTMAGAFRGTSVLSGFP